MNINEIYGGNYLKCADLQGREHTVTIESWVVREFPGQNGQQSRRKVVLAFRGAQKQLVVNATNGAAIAFLYGPDTEEWIGKQITLFPAKTQFGSGMTDCIRVKPPESRGAIANGKPAVRQQIEQKPAYSTSTMRPVAETSVVQRARQIADETADFPSDEIPW